MKGNVATNWKKFKRVWENYEIASGLKTKENEIRTATFLTCVGTEALEIYDGLKFDNDADKRKLEAVHQKFETFCIGETNETCCSDLIFFCFEPGCYFVIFPYSFKLFPICGNVPFHI
jgi:hypothetical protein